MRLHAAIVRFKEAEGSVRNLPAKKRGGGERGRGIWRVVLRLPGERRYALPVTIARPDGSVPSLTGDFSQQTIAIQISVLYNFIDL